MQCRYRIKTNEYNYEVVFVQCIKVKIATAMPLKCHFLCRSCCIQIFSKNAIRIRNGCPSLVRVIGKHTQKYICVTFDLHVCQMWFFRVTHRLIIVIIFALSYCLIHLWWSCSPNKNYFRQILPFSLNTNFDISTLYCARLSVSSRLTFVPSNIKYVNPWWSNERTDARTHERMHAQTPNHKETTISSSPQAGSIKSIF